MMWTNTSLALMTSTLPDDRPAASMMTYALPKLPSISVPALVIAGSDDVSITCVTVGEKTIVFKNPLALASLMAQRSVSVLTPQLAPSPLLVTVIVLNVPGALTTLLAQRSVSGL